MGEVKKEEVLAEIGLSEHKYLALGEIWRIFGLRQSKYASKRQADQFILYRDIYDLAVSVCKEWNVPFPDHGMDSRPELYVLMILSHYLSPIKTFK